MVGLVALSGSICVYSEFLSHRQQVCVSSRQRPVCGVMQRAGNRLVEVKVKDDLPPPCSLLYRHTLTASTSCFFHPLPNPLIFLSPPLFQSSCLIGLDDTEESYGVLIYCCYIYDTHAQYHIFMLWLLYVKISRKLEKDTELVSVHVAWQQQTSPSHSPPPPPSASESTVCQAETVGSVAVVHGPNTNK